MKRLGEYLRGKLGECACSGKAFDLPILYGLDPRTTALEVMMAENKTKQNDQSVEEFLNRVPDEKKRQDSFALLALMKEVTGMEPKMWGDAIVGFGSYHYKYASGREGDAPLAGFSPRKQNLTVYMEAGFDQKYGDLLSKLGKHTTSQSCLYIKKLADVDSDVLGELVRKSFQQAVEKSGGNDG